MENTTPGVLGKRAPIDRKAVAFAPFLTTMPVVPLVDAAPNFAYPMDGNDIVGDCVVAGWDHGKQVITGLLTGTQKNFTQDEIWSFYKTQNPGFDPKGTAATNGPGSRFDQGMNIQLFLEYLVAQKYILAFAKIDHTNEAELKAATYLGLAVITGVILTQAQMADQFAKRTWDYVAGSPNEGGHCIPLVGYKASPDAMTCVTWATLVDCTQPFVSKQMDEAWFILMQEHVDHPGFRNNFDLAGFSQAVSAITGGKVVVPVPVVPDGYVFTRVLHRGMSGADVMELQKRLTTEKASNGAPCFTGTFDVSFGPLTEAALQLYQKTKGLVSSGTWQTTGYGQLGPKTMTLLNSTVVHTSKIDAWADAIQQHEGWFVGSHSYRNNNPGNIKYIGQATATGSDAQGFCIFPTYAAGRAELVGMLTRCATGKNVPAYTPDMSIAQFFARYSPDGTQVAYAAYVAQRIGVSVDTPIKNLL